MCMYSSTRSLKRTGFYCRREKQCYDDSGDDDDDNDCKHTHRHRKVHKREIVMISFYCCRRCYAIVILCENCKFNDRLQYNNNL